MKWIGCLFTVFGCSLIVACSGTYNSNSQPEADTQQSDLPDSSPPIEGPYSGYVSELYTGTENWLCHPDKEDDPCDGNQDVTVVQADGSMDIQTFERAEAPAFDCFYVYFMVSMEGTPNSDLLPGVEEAYVVTNQAARLQKHCRLFAPMYRQMTITSLFSADIVGDWALAYGDVLDAFKSYMATHNQGRGVVLIGHSQGTGHLRSLLQDEFDTSEKLRKQLIAAYLTGGAVSVPEGADVGGSFSNLPLCRSKDQTACIVSYASFRATEAPSVGTLFGIAEEGVAVCNNPAALSGGSAVLKGVFPSEIPGIFATLIKGNVSPFADPENAPELTTPFFSVPGLLTGECVVNNGYSYLEISINADPDDPRADDVGGDFSPGWGLHLVDVNLVMNDIVGLVYSQYQAYLQAQ
ncbi:MAG TPA: DUF3089 domain-containing protein [Myxococcales bacterium]|nr:DUF3089 domain-containing protein [Myxococcales bacterium]